MTAPAVQSASRFWVWALLACAAAYVGLFATFGRFLGLDEVFFKSPGLQWTRTGQFAAPELTGFLQHLQPPLDPPVEEVWFVYPPVYPFLFGLWAKLVGFGPAQCVLFDALIHAALALLTFATARSLREGLPDWVCFAVGVAVLPVGIFCRPDELAMCFGMAGLLALLRPVADWRHVSLSGVLFGLCAAASVGTAILLGLVAVTLLPRARMFRLGAGWALAAGVVFVLAVAPVLIAHPTAFRQYLTHAADHVGRGNFLHTLFTGWRYESFHRCITLGCLLPALAGLAARSPAVPWARWLRLWLGPLLGLGFLAAFFPNKVFYTWFLGPWMMAAAAVTWRAGVLHLPPWGVRIVTVGTFALYAMAIGPFCKGLFAMATLPAEQSLARNAQRVRDLIPPGSTVMTDAYWWVLADDHRVYDLYFGRPAPETLDYVILTGDDSGDPNMVRQVPAYLADYLATHFEPVLNTINTQPVTVLGKPIPNTAFGFGALVLKRLPADAKLARTHPAPPE